MVDSCIPQSYWVRSPHRSGWSSEPFQALQCCVYDDRKQTLALTRPPGSTAPPLLHPTPDSRLWILDVFIELTDHLRCPEDHEESFLVLLPDQMEGRWVKTGQLGCPVCGRTFRMADGVFDTGDAPPSANARAKSGALDAEGLSALIGLGGPGGYLVLVGELAGLWRELSATNPGVALVGVNPGDDVTDGAGVSVIRSGRIPLKSRSMRGVVLSDPYGSDSNWVREAARVVLPGLRVVGQGATPSSETVDLMANAGGVWVGSAVHASRSSI